MKREKENENEEKEEDNKRVRLSKKRKRVRWYKLSKKKKKKRVRYNHNEARLTLNSDDFRTAKGFYKFVKEILSRRRRRRRDLRAIDFQYWGFNRYHPYPDPQLPETISTVVASQNANHLRLHFPDIFGGLIHFPWSVFSSSSLTSLELQFKDLAFPDSLNLPALTFLKLSYLSFDNPFPGMIDPFSTYNSLNTLIFYHCEIMDQKRLLISSNALENLSIHTPECVQYPQIVLSTPTLSTFDFTCNPFQTLSTLSETHLSSIKQVRFDMFEHPFNDDPSSVFLVLRNNLRLLDFFLQMPNIESLILFPTTLKFFYYVREQLKVKPPFFCNLKSLKVVNLYPNTHVSYVPAADTMSWKQNTRLQQAIQAQLEPYSFIPPGVIDIVLQNSPSATVDVLI